MSTIRSARWRSLRQVVHDARVIWITGDNAYSVLIPHPSGIGHGYLELRVSTAKHGFVRARSIGPWPDPLTPGLVLWAVTLDSSDDAKAHAVHYARTGERLPLTIGS
jgi:hypothetical protein